MSSESYLPFLRGMFILSMITLSCNENPSVGLLLCREMNKTMVGLTIRRHNSPMGVATYRTAEDVPDDYKTLRPLLDGAQRILEESEEEPSSHGQEPK